MALPWGKQPSSAAVPGSGELDVSIVHWGERSARNANLFSPGKLPKDGAGCFIAPPGTPYLIDIALKQRVPRSGLRVVRASIDGREINEQVVLRGGSASARFCGWLEDPTGAKRVQFAFPPSGQSVVQVGVFEATEASKQVGAAAKVHPPPPAAGGASFAGPQVGQGEYVLGEPVAASLVRLSSTTS
mmetsp:Transcript_19441/g.48937  ORF Transcript_19441/g.48937 Transcript_19441/m.48937 type:complete len:187 (+) Transcript_19441:50-610(+)